VLLSTICLHINRKAYLACNFNYLFENKGLLKVAASHIHSKCGNISETMPDGVVVTIDHESAVLHSLSNRGNSDDLK